MNYLDKIKRLFNLVDYEINFGYSKIELIKLELRLNIKLPLRLREYYLTLGKHKKINVSHNKLLNPNKEINFSIDRYLIFYEENQSVVSWGIKEIDLKNNNPSVWGNYGTDSSPDWHLEAKDTENFFLLMAITNGTLGGLKYNANSFEGINSKTEQFIKSKWTEITEISWEKQKYYTNNFNEVISLSFDEKENCTAIFIGTSHQSRFDYLLNQFNIDWSYISYEDDE